MKGVSGADRPSGRGKPDTEGIRVLVVEEGLNEGTVIHESLAFLGFSVTTAARGAEAARLASESACEVVVGAFDLPDRPGAGDIRRITGCPDFPRFILIAGPSDGGTAEGACLERAAHLIPRPLSLRRLAQAVQVAAVERRFGAPGLLRSLGPRRARSASLVGGRP